MSFRSFLPLLVLLPVLQACSAETTTNPGEASEPTGTSQSKSTFAFVPDQVLATRTPFHANCLEKNAAFSDDDLFNLQPVEAAAPKNVSSIAISFQRTVTKSSTLDLVLGGPVRGATFENAEHAHSADETTGADVVVFFKAGSTPKKLSKASVTITDVPAKEGDPTTAHVTLEFADGDVLDETFTGALKSYDGACGGGG